MTPELIEGIITLGIVSLSVIFGSFMCFFIDRKDKEYVVNGKLEEDPSQDEWGNGTEPASG